MLDTQDFAIAHDSNELKIAFNGRSIIGGSEELELTALHFRDEGDEIEFCIWHLFGVNKVADMLFDPDFTHFEIASAEEAYSKTIQASRFYLQEYHVEPSQHFMNAAGCEVLIYRIPKQRQSIDILKEIGAMLILQLGFTDEAKAELSLKLREFVARAFPREQNLHFFGMRLVPANEPNDAPLHVTVHKR